MEVSGVSFRPLPCLSGASFDTQSSSKLSFSSSNINVGEHRVLGRSRKFSRVLSCAFSDNGHLQYYVSPKAGLNMEKEKKKKKKDSEKASLKKKLKLVKGMSKDLLRFSSMGFGVEVEDGLMAEVKGKKISEATEILLSQLKQLKAEEKELKRKKKTLKALMVGESSSSSSSESSGSECGEVIDMSSLRSGATVSPKLDEPHIEFDVPVQEISTTKNRNLAISRVEEAEASASASASASTSCSSSSVMVGEKIEVCMGGKCKKSGASALLEEFQQRVGIEGAVVGCKCMGKCRDGPNVRVVNQCSGDPAMKLDDDGVKPQTNPLCIGVSLEDVGVIVGNFFGEGKKEMGLMVA